MITRKSALNIRLLLSSLVISGAFGGCATTSTQVNPNDPWVGWNRGAQSFNDDVDDAILKPVAKGYLAITSEAVDQGVTNFFSNLNDIGVTVNDFLQLKFLQGGMDASRFIVNTTAGMAGIFDVAKHIDLPKHNEDFGQTLGFWGVPSGSYLVLPFFGASSPRDTVGLVGDALLNPLTYASLFGGAAINAVTTGTKAVDVADTRAGLMSTEKMIDEASVDRYDFIKNAYQQHREYLIHDGNPPQDENDLLEPDEDIMSEGTGDNKESAASSSANLTKGSTAIPALGNPYSVPVIDNSNSMPAAPASSSAPVIDNSRSIPAASNPSSAPVTNNSRHMLDLSAPDDK
ncbi:Surface lipoprotein [Candidatus Methylobacter favarea]|uniref:Surface lipoprotein n=1 Tax=Candidatus Methylobacter favarea TaxID=2707345 RepID=A0A8S0X234_9GAMM|nr:Surface lipoprotein [Candidatus Methylobacter favarea]